MRRWDRVLDVYRLRPEYCFPGMEVEIRPVGAARGQRGAWNTVYKVYARTHRGVAVTSDFKNGRRRAYTLPTAKRHGETAGSHWAWLRAAGIDLEALARWQQERRDAGLEWRDITPWMEEDAVRKEQECTRRDT